MVGRPAKPAKALPTSDVSKGVQSQLVGGVSMLGSRWGR